MTKLEELTALLVNEINDFKNGVEKLDKINDRLGNTKIKIDLAEYKVIIESHQQKMAAHTDILERFEKQLKNAKIYPSWAVIVFIFCFVCAIVFGFLYFFK